MVYKQGDPAWGHVTLGYGPATIGEAGCLLTAFAQVLRHYGFPESPLTLNQKLKDAGRWINGDLLADASIVGLFPGVQLVTKWDFSHRAADLSVLTNNQQDEYIIEVDFDHDPTDGIQTHFVRFVSYIDGKLVIDDPQYGSEDDFTKHYGTDFATTIIKIVKYVGPNAPIAPVPPVPAAPAFDRSTITAVSGFAHVNNPANVRTGPGVAFPISAEYTAGGKLQPGVEFTVVGEVFGDDPYGDGRNKWAVSRYGNTIWEGNLTMHLGAKGGGTGEDTAPAQPEVNEAADEVGDETAAAPAEKPADELEPIGYQAWLKPALTDQTRHYEGAPVVDLDTLEPVEVFEMGAKAPFTHIRKKNGANYLVTEHMVKNGLNYGIDGLNLTTAEQPANVVSAEQAVATTPEDAAQDQDTSVQELLESLGPIWRPLVKFLERHHPNNK